MILNSSQAEAVYNAMCALNNVNGRVTANIEGIQVREVIGGNVFVTAFALATEQYGSQFDFAAAYGLNPDAT